MSDSAVAHVDELTPRFTVAWCKQQHALHTAAAAFYCGYSGKDATENFRVFAQRHRIPHAQHGKKLFFLRADLDHFLAGGTFPRKLSR